uniref:C-type lectin domain-containing protein n=1 Tax=Stegastes partitus TaxID=144197 RepID=A0A3B5AY00_9TELE
MLLRNSVSHVLYFSSISATNPPGQKTYILSPTSMTWFDARAYCRTHYTDLAIIENDQENTQMLSVKSNITVWIGLYRVSWRWSDNSSSSFRNWMNGQPNNANNQYCAAETQDHVWNDAPCSKKMPFCCLATNLELNQCDKSNDV